MSDKHKLALTLLLIIIICGSVSAINQCVGYVSLDNENFCYDILDDEDACLGNGTICYWSGAYCYSLECDQEPGPLVNQSWCELIDYCFWEDAGDIVSSSLNKSSIIQGNPILLTMELDEANLNFSHIIVYVENNTDSYIIYTAYGYNSLNYASLDTNLMPLGNNIIIPLVNFTTVPQFLSKDFLDLEVLGGGVSSSSSSSSSISSEATTTTTTTVTTLPNNPVYITFTRQDYTGTWLTSTLHIQDNYSGSWVDYVSGIWDANAQVGPVMVEQNQFYKIVVTNKGSTLDKGVLRWAANGTQPITITAPITSYAYSPLKDLNISLSQDRNLNKLYCYVAVTNPALNFTIAYFNVYNASVFPAELIYYADSEYSPIQFQYTIPNINETYKIECLVYIGGQRYSQTNTYAFGNNTVRFMGANAPSNFLGYSTSELFTGVSLFLIVFLAGIASAINASIMMLGVIGLLWLFYYFGWFPINQYLLGFLIIFAIALRLSRGKEGKG